MSFLQLRSIDPEIGTATFGGPPDGIRAWSHCMRTHQGEQRQPTIFFGGDQKRPVGKVVKLQLDDAGATIKATFEDSLTLKMLDSGVLTGMTFNEPGSASIVDRAPKNVARVTFKSIQSDGSVLTKSFHPECKGPQLTKDYARDGSYRLRNPFFAQRPNRNAV